ncbi:MAG: LacI family DNA-binding transcriptional regulator [Flammeovirgaceae bacterium]
MKKNQVTLKDIAQHLGVSVATVSRALKDFPDIGEETKQAVKKLAEEWNYRPNTMAISLRKKKSKVIGVLVPEIVHHFFSSVISGIMDELEQHDYSVMLFQTNESLHREIRDIDVLLNSRVDGLLISLSNESTSFEHILNAQRMGIPVVLFDKVTDQIDCSKVVVDDYEGAYAATKHLIEQGCQRIAHIKGPEHPKNAKERLRGYVDALKAYNLPIDDSMILACKQVVHEEGYAFTQHLLDMKSAPDGIFAITDAVAIGAMVAIKERKLKIPNDVALVGFSNWRMAAVVEPSLTSVHQPGYEMGKEASKLLLGEIQQEKKEPQAYQRIVLKTNLVVRDSSVRHP